ncbi:hypothetical protein D047_3635B, partial [Vibrio parahaemolyticus VPTS-2010_2]
AWLKT